MELSLTMNSNIRKTGVPLHTWTFTITINYRNIFNIISLTSVPFLARVTLLADKYYSEATDENVWTSNWAAFHNPLLNSPPFLNVLLCGTVSGSHYSTTGNGQLNELVAPVELYW
jgi:hypothetical protein